MFNELGRITPKSSDYFFGYMNLSVLSINLGKSNHHQATFSSFFPLLKSLFTSGTLFQVGPLMVRFFWCLFSTAQLVRSSTDNDICRVCSGQLFSLRSFATFVFKMRRDLAFIRTLLSLRRRWGLAPDPLAGREKAFKWWNYWARRDHWCSVSAEEWKGRQVSMLPIVLGNIGFYFPSDKRIQDPCFSSLLFKFFPKVLQPLSAIPFPSPYCWKYKAVLHFRLFLYL